MGAGREAVVDTVVKIVATWLIVDLISGVVHWFEDSYGAAPSIPFIGRRVTTPNLAASLRPRAFVSNSWYASSRVAPCSVCAAALVVAWLLGRLSPMVVLGAVLGANANQVHKWSHRTPAENGPAVGVAQRLLLIQSPGHHHQHHSGRKISHYCVLTNLLNPVLDGFRVWRGLESVLRQGGLRKRDDDQLLVVVLAGDPGFLDRPRS